MQSLPGTSNAAGGDALCQVYKTPAYHAAAHSDEEPANQFNPLLEIPGTDWVTFPPVCVNNRNVQQQKRLRDPTCSVQQHSICRFYRILLFTHRVRCLQLTINNFYLYECIYFLYWLWQYLWCILLFPLFPWENMRASRSHKIMFPFFLFSF